MASHSFRIDKFTVPEAARAEFLARVAETHEVLRGCQGFVRDVVYEQYAGPGAFNLITLVEWADQAAIDGAVKRVKAAQDASGFDPRETMARLGITGDIAFYRELTV
ncbi:antibiotic biosynthesis monooxygenase [Pseudoruegeria sp. HB172150]|uniref:antibiotic biosynthesis monooxygenase n=1 Tax=Pseudoruegeria sp. HB172150 TaxID=2721164 RepID=UPI001557C504|nr:antibiotic biosynthesis monooxygenase [Pseudoruegeria sp. HB172150]